MGVPRATTEALAFGKYTLVAKLAKGGMAEILLARLQGAAGFEKLVCIKRILEHLAEDEQFISMFLAEARIAAMISHPNVCQVFELGEIDGNYFISMEYLEGVPLAAFRRKDMYPPPPDPALVAAFGVQACEGLHHAHELQRPDGSSLDVVHRDVSGQNLFVTTAGVVKVLDFGIAKIQDASMRTTTGAVKGTYAYMAPEQLRGEAIDRRADVFAMGIVMWETLAQEHLFRRDTDFLTFQAISTDPIPDIRIKRPDVPDPLADAITRAMARDKAERFPTARAFGEALARAVQPLGGAASPATISEEIKRAFAPRLAEQRALVKLAREGRALDLRTDQGSSLGHGTAMLATPTSAAMVTRPSGPVRIPTGPRSETMSVAPLPVVAANPWLRRGLIAAGLIGAVVVAGVVLSSRSGSPPRTEPPPTSAAVVMAVESPAAVAPVPAPAETQPTPPEPAPPTPPADTPPDRTPPDTLPPPAKRVPAQAAGFLTIDSTPVYATIVIDGKSYGETPLFNIKLSAGKHVIKAISPSKATRVERVTIEPGKIAVRRLEW